MIAGIGGWPQKVADQSGIEILFRNLEYVARASEVAGCMTLCVKLSTKEFASSSEFKPLVGFKAKF